MSLRVALHHHTQYDYDRSVFLSTHWVRLKPAAHSAAFIESYNLTIQPDSQVVRWQQDPFGNFVARVDFEEPLQRMTIDVSVVARLEPVNPFNFLLDAYAESFPFHYEPQLQADLTPYLVTETSGPKLTNWLRQFDQPKQNTIEFLIKLNQQTRADIAYTERLQSGTQTPEETLEKAIGSCRDSGWLVVQTLRQLGLAARFVSGYLVQVASEAPPAAESGDSLALHAWAEVYIPGAGWIGLDPTSGMLATEGHIPLACTSHPTSAAPVTGMASLSESTLTYSSSLTRLAD